MVSAGLENTEVQDTEGQAGVDTSQGSATLRQVWGPLKLDLTKVTGD